MSDAPDPPAPPPPPQPQEPGDDRPPSKPAQVGEAVMKGVRDAFNPVARLVEAVGGHILLALRAFAWLPRRPYRPRNYLEAMEYVGFGSLPIVLLVGGFTGMVTALQSVFAFRTFGIEHLTGGITGQALATELGPVLTSLMLAGRVGAGIATEIGTMRISEQIDALESMAISPVQFLVLPRLVAGAVMGPILVLLFFIVGMAGAYLVSVINLGVDHGQFVYNFREMVLPVDLMQGLIKGVLFGFVVVLIGCYQGYNASGGGRGVGMGTTRAVVLGSVSVLILDYFVTEILLALLPVER